VLSLHKSSRLLFTKDGMQSESTCGRLIGEPSLLRYKLPWHPVFEFAFEFGIDDVASATFIMDKPPDFQTTLPPNHNLSPLSVVNATDQF